MKKLIFYFIISIFLLLIFSGGYTNENSIFHNLLDYGAATSLQDTIDMGLITNDEDEELSVNGNKPTAVKVKMDSMVAHWSMNGGSGTEITDLVGGNNGTMIGLDPESAWLPGIGISVYDPCSGIRFDNVDGHHIEVPSSDAIDFGDESFTISMLIRYLTPPTDTDRWIIKGTHGTPGTGSRYELFFKNSGTVGFAIDNGPDNIKSQIALSGEEAIVTGDWVHIVAVRDALNDSLMIYVSGIWLGGTADRSGDISNGEPLWIGESTDETSTAMSGDIKDVRLYNKALTEYEIHLIYPIPSHLPDSYPCWDFDETSGITAHCKNERLHGTLHNMDDSLWDEGLVNNCLDFGSGNDSSYVEVPDNYTIDFNSCTGFSISVLVSITDINVHSDNFILFKGHTDNYIRGHWYGLSFKENKLMFAIDDAVTESRLEFQNAHKTMRMDSWNHIVGVYDVLQDSLFIYLNGEKVASMLYNAEISLDTSPLPLIIGNNTEHNNNFKGKIDELQIDQHAWSADRIKRLFDSYGITTDVASKLSAKPVTYGLMQNYPNPFNPSTKIVYHIPYKSKVRIVVYDIVGRKIAELIDEEKPAGNYEINFEAGNLSSGVYIYQLSYSGLVVSKKMLLLR